MMISKTSELVHEANYYIEKFNNASTIAECELYCKKLEKLAKELRNRCVDSSVIYKLERYGF